MGDEVISTQGVEMGTSHSSKEWTSVKREAEAEKIPGVGRLMEGLGD